MIIKTGNLTLGSAVVNSVSNTDRLQVGMFVYGVGVDFESKVLTIDNLTQFTMDKIAVTTGSTISLQMTFATSGLFLETTCALSDVEEIAIERGKSVTFIKRDEDGVTRDAYGSVKTRASTEKILFKAMPVDFQPTRRALELAGLRQEADVLVCTCKKKWNDLGIDFEDIDSERVTIEIEEKTYEIKEKTLMDQFGEDFLYIVFGVFRK